MTFLELVQRLHSEASMTGSTPANVTGQTGETARSVKWVLSAYEDIQNIRYNWNFLREDFTFPTVSGTQTYAGATVGLTDFGIWDTKDVRCYGATVNDEVELTFFPWSEFKKAYLFGSSRTSAGMPSTFSVNQDESIVLWPIPDAIYTVNGSYYKTAQTMTVSADIPILPARYHMAIVWRALMFYAAYEEAVAVYQHGDNEFNRVMYQMEKDQLPKFTWGSPLA